MNRSNDLYQKVTDEIIAALEKGGKGTRWCR